MKALFHKAGREGRKITIIRQRYAKQGIYINSNRAALVIKLMKLKKLFYKRNIIALFTFISIGITLI